MARNRLKTLFRVQTASRMINKSGEASEDRLVATRSAIGPVAIWRQMAAELWDKGIALEAIMPKQRVGEIWNVDRRTITLPLLALVSRYVCVCSLQILRPLG